MKITKLFVYFFFGPVQTAVRMFDYLKVKCVGALLSNTIAAICMYKSCVNPNGVSIMTLPRKYERFDDDATMFTRFPICTFILCVLPSNNDRLPDIVFTKCEFILCALCRIDFYYIFFLRLTSNCHYVFFLFLYSLSLYLFFYRWYLRVVIVTEK